MSYSFSSARNADYVTFSALERKDGVHFAMAGTAALVAALVRLAEGEGVRFHVRQRVTEVLIEDGSATGVRLADGREQRADCVVANAAAPALYRQLVPERWRRRWTDRRIESRKYSIGPVVVYLGVRRQYPELAHHTILFGEWYKELLEEVFEGDRLSEDLSLYLHAPTRTDPSLAPPGCESLYVLAHVPNLRAGIDWAAQAQLLEERILDVLEATVCPGLRSNETQEMSDGELYWFIKNGVRWSGMPVFGKPGDDDDHAWRRSLTSAICQS